MEKEKQERIGWIDVARGIAISLVVFGHIMKGGEVRRIVYSFHVSLFFMLSGMTCKVDSISKRIRNDFFRIMIPYYCFGIISIAIFGVLGQFAANQLGMSVNTSLKYNIMELLYASSIDDGMKFNMPLWFLPCLFVTKLIFYSLYKIFRGKKIHMFLASLIIFVIGFIYTRLGWMELPFDLSISFKMLVYFMVGYCFIFFVKNQQRACFLKNQRIILGGIMTIAGSIVASYSPALDYSNDRFPNMLFFLITSILGSFGICYLSMGVAKCEVLESIGKKTLAILVMHKFPVLLFQTIEPTKTLLRQYDSFYCIVVSVLLTYVVIAMCFVVEKIIQKKLPFLFGIKMS